MFVITNPDLWDINLRVKSYWNIFQKTNVVNALKNSMNNRWFWLGLLNSYPLYLRLRLKWRRLNHMHFVRKALHVKSRWQRERVFRKITAPLVKLSLFWAFRRRPADRFQDNNYSLCFFCDNLKNLMSVPCY